jgi:PKD repeat protein
MVFSTVSFAYAKCPTLPRNLEFGDIGDDVADLHSFLKLQGISGDDGNIFGEKTLESIKFFQGSLVLPQTGVVDAATRKKVAEECKTEAATLVRDGITVRPATGKAPLQTVVTLTLGDGADNTFNIDFGDGTNAKAAACKPDGTCKNTLQAKHTFKLPGNYMVKLFRDYGESGLGNGLQGGKSAVMEVPVFVEYPESAVIPQTCKEWFDGCNTCLRKSLGSDFSCPKKKCVGALKERICKSFFYINKPPVVTVTGFKTVLNNITRQYQVRATDPEGAAVQYAIDWGDGTSEETPTRYFKTGLFSHAYKDGGTYTVTGFARDVSGDVGKKTSVPRRTSLYVVQSMPAQIRCVKKYSRHMETDASLIRHTQQR